MNWIKANKYQTAKEEKWNAATHLAGLVFFAGGLVALVLKAVEGGSAKAILSSVVFGVSLILVYLSSSLYHLQKDPEKKKKLRVLDHANIFVLIAGTYTPLTLLILNNTAGWIFFGIEWGLAIAGIVLKIFYTGRFQKLSLGIYLFMGWLIVIDISELIEKLPPDSFQFILYGGIAYTLGIVFYLFKRIYFSHVMWHLFVLAGSLFHFWFVYAYAL